MSSSSLPLLRMPEVARLLGISRSKAYMLVRRGQLPGVVRIGATLRVSRPHLERWIEEQAAATARPTDV